MTLKSGTTFPVNTGETILDAALRAGLSVEHSCKTGRCSSCKCRVVTGVTQPLLHETDLSAEDGDAGWILSCCRTAANDIVLDTAEITRPLPPARIVPAKVDALLPLSPDILQVRLRLPPQLGFDFFAGQYVDLATVAGLKRSYSIANARGPGIQFLIRRVEGGAMSRYWFAEAKVGDLLRVHGPKGTFFVREPLPRQLVFLATGTGIAPVQAMLQSLEVQALDSPPRVVVLWGNRIAPDLVADPRQSLGSIEYIPVLSRADAAWTGARGHIQQHFHALGDDLADTTVYACGSAAMIASSRAQLAAMGLPDNQFFADAFVCSASSERV